MMFWSFIDFPQTVLNVIKKNDVSRYQVSMPGFDGYVFPTFMYKDYYVTTIRNFRVKRDKLRRIRDKLLQRRINEGILHFRNITKMTTDLAFVCPYCNKARSK